MQISIKSIIIIPNEFCADESCCCSSPSDFLNISFNTSVDLAVATFDPPLLNFRCSSSKFIHRNLVNLVTAPPP